jgi:hypothetical protein
MAPAASAQAARAKASAAPPVATVEPPGHPTTTVKREFVQELPCNALFFPTTGRTFVACERQLWFVGESGSIERNASLERGLKLDADNVWSPRIAYIAGQWPNAAWSVTQEAASGGNSVLLRFFRWRKERWAPVTAGVDVFGALGWVGFPWGGDGLVALVPQPFEPTRLLAFGAKPVAVPALTKAVQSKEEAAQYRCRNAMIMPEAWAELAANDVLVFAGQLCGASGANASEGQDRFFGAERLRAGQKQGELTLLPLPAELPPHMGWFDVVAAALSPTDVLVASEGIEDSEGAGESRRRFPYLAHFDGQAWRTEPAPLGKATALWAGAGVFWATDAEGALWMRREARWYRVEWSDPTAQVEGAASENHGHVSQLHADRAGTLWLVRSKEGPGWSVTSRIYRLRVEP